MQYTFKLNKTWTALTIILFVSISLIMYWNGNSGEDILKVLVLMFMMLFFVLGSAFWVVFPIAILMKWWKRN